jgi:hypothetical protein
MNTNIPKSPQNDASMRGVPTNAAIVQGYREYAARVRFRLLPGLW